ncbi:MAG: hypothetical protein COU40_00050 [Candidatus Moranbacteria bacterium CG10_big_fil_rev_8_21_14_0_10_35_21]|nr:MAG: hypothetical protein COU40_00050 [Candidatus Moranbacteria bacterium CG10_big_fil_rev_8_21_14_0_10_35_21]PJA88449.1 MAG: hypothetical protein CO139_03015 [Candidatus Moranbacteria bacterium CG_4_9_14_3_um_filter_36_9]
MGVVSFLNIKEKIFLYSLVIILIGSIVGWGVMSYLSRTEAVPKYGGEYIEGIVGQPLHINPILSQSNNADEDLVQMTYSGLLRYENDGQLKNDLAESYEISEDKTQYTVRLKKDVFWHDKKTFSAKDVVFTLNLITDPAYKSPLRLNWQGVEVTSEDDHTIVFKIKTPYVGFLNNLTFGILPKHIWESVNPEKFALTNLNLEPIGTGPYKYTSFQKDSNGNILSYKLVANPNYFEGKPNIAKLTFNFYADDEEIINAYNKKEIMGISSLSSGKIGDLKLQQSTATHKFNVPRYFAVFLNQTQSLPLAYDEVREAIAYATDRNEIISEVLGGNGYPVSSPFLKGMTGYTEEINKMDFDPEKANRILDEKGWPKGEDGFRAKDGDILQISLVTTDWPELAETAEILKRQWEKIGVKVEVNTFSISDIQQNYIRPREYDALLFGQVLGGDSDPYSFWHSTQKKDPGLNLSLFGDGDTDKLIDSVRTEFDLNKRAEIYKEFQDKLIQEIPAIFLYSPNYIYPINKKVRGIEIQNLVSPARRFANINHWYLKTKRIWK